MKKRGGKREGAGRPKTGRSVVTRSVSMEPETWDKLDIIRGNQSRGQWIAAKVKKAR
jgi:hypothetical protein